LEINVADLTFLDNLSLNELGSGYCANCLNG
jgi:hypothetical protein